MNSKFLKIVSLNSISLILRIVTGFITSKAIAYFIGPSGMALVGNLRNFLASLEAVSILGIQNGIVKRVAQNSEDKPKISKLFSNHFKVITIISIAIGILIILFSAWISHYIFKSEEYSMLLKLVGLLFPFQVLNVYFISVLNGLGLYKKVVSINILSYVVGLIISVLLLYFYQVYGAILAVSIMGFVLSLVSSYYVKKEIATNFSFSQKVNFFDFKITLSYGMMTLFSAIISPLLYLLIRNYIAEMDSFTEAGYYEAMNKISALYMMFISSVITLFFLPEFSKDKSQIKPLTKTYYLQIIPLFAAGLVVLYFLRSHFIPLFLTKDFLPVSDLFLWQMIGDFFKAAALILGIQFYVKRLIKSFYIFEIISFSCLLFFSYWGINKFKAEGAVMAYALTYVIYFVLLALYFTYRWKKKAK